ncbi:MAG: PstS family phosphate ABC transporter substrate-binding protein [Lawsonibacter sp.]
MKHLFLSAGLSLILVLSACGLKAPAGNSVSGSTVVSSSVSQPVQTEAPFVFTRDNFPRLDGSASSVSLAKAMCAVLLGEDLDQVANLINFSRTTQSYRNLMAGDTDLLIAAAPDPQVLSELEAGDQWLLTPFATDALVFVINQNNPVDNLTREQVQKIYTGEITNWREVGGDDLDIIPFQRNEEAGVQTMFETLVMDGQEPMDAPAVWISDSLSRGIRAYDNSSAAIGYTVYSYASDMEMAQGLKVLSIDGVQPSADSIQVEEYPFLNPYFIAISKDAREDSPTRILYDWVLGPDGKKLATLEGYIPVTGTEG